MLYLVHMQVGLPDGMPAETAAALKAREKEYSQRLQHEGKWKGLWRVVGQYANYSLFEVPGNDELHELLSGLPLYPYMRIEVIPLAKHPSSIV